MKLLAAAQLTIVSVTLLGSIACGAKTPTEPTPTPPAPVYELKTETFSGNVKTGGAVSFPFTVVNPGDIQVSITAMAPTSTLAMGIALGYWETATLTCVEQLRTTTATINVAFAATPSSPGEYCVGIFDTGNVTVASDFTLSVTHY
jgi:hypothetical protein